MLLDKKQTNEKKAIKIGIIVFFCYIFPSVGHAQSVGVNTNNPQATLDVVGDINLRKDLKVSNLDGSGITSGLKGQALVSIGPNLSPEWKDVEGTRTTYRIKESIVKTDEVGVIFTDQNKMNITSGFKEDSELTASWKEIVGLKSELTPTDVENRVLITLQTMCHTDNFNNVDYLFSIGIFLDGKLRATRPLNLTGSSYVFEPSVLYDSFEDLPMKNNNESYVVQVAVCQRYRNIYDASGSWKVAVGTSATSLNANNWMNKTSMKIELYEVFLD